MDPQQKAIEILKNDFVCDNCLGRQFANLLSGFSNEERGRIVRLYLAMARDAGGEINIEESNFYGFNFHNINIAQKKPKKCSVCGGALEKIKKKAQKIVKELEKYQYKTFLVGSLPTKKLLEKEQELWGNVGIDWCEPIRSEINRILGKEIESLTGKKMDRKNSDITVLYDLKKDKVTLYIRSIFIYGKYQKLSRKMPQTTWKTRIYPISVQDIIAKPFMKQTQSQAHRLHGAGREDVDVRCLGWRPFILELISPKKRTISISEAIRLINRSKKVKVKALKMSDKRAVTIIKAMKPDKTYKAEVVFEKPVENLEAVNSLKGAQIIQETPIRVISRRADRKRRKKIIDIKYKKKGGKKVEFTIRAQTGTYIKELIHGDEGRTNPNITDLIGNKVKSIKLDVIKIHCD